MAFAHSGCCSEADSHQLTASRDGLVTGLLGSPGGIGTVPGIPRCCPAGVA
jgi:hypothetical protein